MTEVDTHVHVFHRGLPLAPERRYSPSEDATWQTYLRILDEHRIGRALLVQPSFLGTDNTYVLAASRARPDRFRAVVVVDTQDLPTATASLPAMHAAGARGIRLNIIGGPVPALERPEWQALGETMAAMRWHLEVQARGEQWSALAPDLSRWPGAVVIDHVGLPQGLRDPQWKPVLDLAARPHVWVKASGYYRSPDRTAAHAALTLRDTVGIDRLLWGSDWPWTQFEDGRRYGGLLAELHDLLPVQDDVEQVLVRNPARLLDWP
ncbi:amidohydrolase family protein [Streptomyces sp. 8K308]|uniref:amidohydrolase family protein n=1 Tax=Streptomyces sp. 8K308 TaxID=2530388 RepID=UPI0014048F12|nr:amidohydrolase family protein [Streptomyces sp. 8K308]